MTLTIRQLKSEEISDVASFIATGYQEDVFFKWVVPSDEDRHSVVNAYYKIYLGAEGAMAYVAEDTNGAMVGASVWLPHDVDTSIYDDIEQVAGSYAPQFQAVANASHDSVPADGPFYELVGFVTRKDLQGQGIGYQLLKAHLDAMDEKGIPTYLEASTPFHERSIYRKFGYDHHGDTIAFENDAAFLYPLYRPAKRIDKLC